MSYLSRVTPNKTTTSNIETIYNEKGQIADANTKEVLVPGQIDKGHKHGYEERAMRMCAERCHMTQKEYNKMMQNSKLYQFESSHNNRSHKFECDNRMQQLHNCFEVIRDYKGKNRNRISEKYGKSDFTFNNSTKSLNHAQRGNVITGKAKSGHSSSAVTGTHGAKASGTNHGGSSLGGSHGGHSGSVGGISGGHGGHGGSGAEGGHGR